jgi:HAE1 family hydrophobic/amphiphilic exporter-1
VVIGGLISSTALTLVLVPVLYRLVEGRREKRALQKAVAAPPLRNKRGRRAKATPHDAEPGRDRDEDAEELRVPTGTR